MSRGVAGEAEDIRSADPLDKDRSAVIPSIPRKTGKCLKILPLCWQRRPDERRGVPKEGFADKLIRYSL